MGEVPAIARSARRHGVSDEDMRHAMRNAIALEDVDEGMVMHIGPARNGAHLEVGVVAGAHGVVVVHAMPARPRFFPLGRRS